MKKFIFGLVFSLGFMTLGVPSAQADIWDDLVSTVDVVTEVASDVVGVVNDVTGLFDDGSSSGATSTGSFDGDDAQIYEGDVIEGGVDIAVDNIVSSGTVVVEDFDALFESLEPGEGVTPTGEFVLPDPEKFNQIGENTSLRQYILNVLNFALTFLGLIAVVFIVYAGFLYVVSSGDDGNTEKAKKIILYAVIGILVILAAFAIVNTVIQNAGRGTSDRGEIPDNNGGTVITTASGETILISDDETGDSLISASLGTTITISGAGVEDFGTTVVATPEAARAGVKFGLNLQGQALIDFGDGTQGLLDNRGQPNASLVHAFGEERTYPIRAIVETPSGSMAVEKDLVVGGLDAQFTVDRAEVTVGEPLGLSAKSTQITVGSVESYDWSCSGNSAGCFADTFGQEATVSFATPGEYQITLEVTSVLGTVDTSNKTVRVVSTQPLADFDFVSTRNPQKPSEFTFDASQSVNRAGESSGLTYFWNFAGDFQQVGVPIMTYEFASTGSKVVELVVVESGQAQSSPVSKTVEVETVLGVDFTLE